MYASITVYAGAILALGGLLTVVMPGRTRTRRRALGFAAGGVALTAAALAAPVGASRTSRSSTRLDEFVPVWQFNEVHTIEIDASPDQVFDALSRVTADEIAFFRTLTWIRRGGRASPTSILNPGSDRPLLQAAIQGGFILLADAAPREIVLGTVVVAPRGARRPFTPTLFQNPVPPGFALGAMNFLLTPDGANGSILSTETRVFASDPATTRRFARYWRVIYPGSALIRRMWLRAVNRRVSRDSRQAETSPCIIATCEPSSSHASPPQPFSRRHEQRRRST